MRNLSSCPECGERTTGAKRRMGGNPGNFSHYISTGVAYCPSCLWTERDPDEQKSLTYEFELPED